MIIWNHIFEKALNLVNLEKVKLLYLLSLSFAKYVLKLNGYSINTCGPILGRCTHPNRGSVFSWYLQVRKTFVNLEFFFFVRFIFIISFGFFIDTQLSPLFLL